MPRLRMLLPALLVAMLPGGLYAQISDGNIVGAVFDQTGAAVARATVELDNPATGVKITRTTDNAGFYRFNNVPVGSYNVTASATGFGKKTLENVRVELNRSTTVNVTLEVSQVATQIEVKESAAVIDTTTATIGASFDQQQAMRLPAMNLTSGVLNLALLGAGVAHSGGLGLGEGPSVGGQRPRQNNFMIEGIDNNRKDVTGANLKPSNEAVQEFSMLQNQFTAEFGHSTGGQFNTVVKSGTNSLHGSLYEYFRNRNLEAVDESFKRSGILSNPRYDDNRFGGTAGGPIIRNKLFYFGNYEYNPVGFAQNPSAATLTPTAEGYAMLGSIPGVSQTNLDVLRTYAKPAATATDTTSVAGVNIPIGVLPVAFPAFQNNYNWLASIDYNLSDRDQIRGRYIEQRFSGLDSGVAPNLEAFVQQRTVRQRLVALSEFHQFSATVFNEFRAAYSRYDDTIPAGDFQYPGLDAFPNVEIQQDLNLQLGPFTNAPQSGIQNTYQLVNNLTWLKGRHSLKFGFDGRKYIAPTNFIQRVRGDYNYSNLERFLLDLNPDVLAERNTGGVPYDGNQIDAYWYAQDEFKMNSHLTLTAGIRYEYKGIPAGDKLQALNAISDVPGLITFAAPKVQKTNFAPRIGLAYSPGQSGATVIRAGFGMAYDVYFDNFGTLSKPVQLENTVIVDPAANIPDFLKNGGIRTDQRPDQIDQETARAFTSTFIPDQRLPYSLQWNVGVQRVFKNDYTLDVRYLGTRGVRLFVQDRPNIIARVTPNRSLPTYLQAPSQAELNGLPLTLNDLRAGSNIKPEYLNAGFQSPITAFRNIGNSIYHGLATEISRRFSNGLLFRGSYTWSHAIDDSTADLFSTLVSPRRAQDFQNYQAERGTSFLDRRHRFVFTWVYDSQWFKGSGNWMAKNLLGNWNFAGTYTKESPQFATVQSGTDSNLNGDSAGDRTIINTAGADKTGSDVSALTNSAGQTVAYLALNPNARYIKAGQGAYANGGKITLPLRPINNFDLTLGKRFNITEHKSFEINWSLVNAFNHPQYTAGSINTVFPFDSTQTRNHLIPGNALFNDPTQVYDSHSRIMFLVARFLF